MKLLTVTVPSYNVEKTLGATLDSLCIDEILDYLDIVIVDDGSTDHTPDIASSYAERFPGSVRVIRKANGGHGSAVNAGMDAAQGKYFKVVDGDDRLDRQGFIALAERLRATEADLVLSNYLTVAPSGRKTLKAFDGVEFGRLYRFEELPDLSRLYFGIHSMTIKTSILVENHIRLQEHTFYVDVEYGLLPVPYVETAVFTQQPVYLYALGSLSQSVSTQNFVKRYDDHDRVVKRMVEYVRQADVPAEKKAYMYGVLGRLCFTHYMLAAFYDTDTARGRRRARAFDAWLKASDRRAYKTVGSSLYITLLRATGFAFLPRGAAFKRLVKRIYSLLKPLFARKRKLTY